MKNQMKGKKGITLIALVLTIIVLLILAGVTIVTLTGDNGLLTKASDAKKANEEATALEKIKVEVAGSYGLDGKIDVENQLNKNLYRIDGLTYDNKAIKLDGNDKNVIEKLPATVKLDGYSYTISENGKVNKITEWIDNHDGSFTNEELRINLTVGDRVKYEQKLETVSLTSNSKLITDLLNYSGNTDSTVNTTDTILQEKETHWRVLDVKDGKIRLVSTAPTESQIKLQGHNGYNNAVYLLDEVCDTLYSTKTIGKAQNLKIEDIEEKFKTSRMESLHGETVVKKEYNSHLYYPDIYPQEIGCLAVSENNNIGKLDKSEQNLPVTGISMAMSRIKLTHTSWQGIISKTDFVNEEYQDLFMSNNYNKYFLSSRCVICNNDYASFRIFIIDGVGVTSDVLCCTVQRLE